MNLLSNNVFRQLVSRAIRTDYLENLTGFVWLILQPLLLLAVYFVVFTTVLTRPGVEGVEIRQFSPS